MSSVKDMVSNGQMVRFVCYRDSELWYETESKFQFPVPIDEAKGGVFLAEDRALLFMRFIRKHLEAIKH